MIELEHVEIPERLSEADLTVEQAVKLAQGNHIWLNAFSCVRPTDEMYADVGRMVVDMLNSSPVDGDFMGVKIGKVAYIRVNKS